MSLFTPCTGMSNCTEGGTHCRGCGRTHAEIMRTRWLIDSAANLALAHDYENEQEFADYIAGKIVKFVRYRREQESGR